MARSSPIVDADQRRLIFQVGEQRHEIDAESVLEVVRAPFITRVPNGPDALAGMANIRGRPVPVLSMARMLNSGAGQTQHGGKIIVYDHGGAIGLLVDDVLQLSTDAPARQGEVLLDLFDSAFKVARRRTTEKVAHLASHQAVQPAVKLTTVLSFRVTGQLYALPIDQVREVTATLSDISTISNAEASVVGLVQVRDRVLPLVSLASLLGLDGRRSIDAGSRTIIVECMGDLIGLVVDELDVIHRFPDSAVDVVPALLQRGRGEAQIDAIGRSESGQLISILSTEKLFRHEAVQKVISQNTGFMPVEKTEEKLEQSEQFLFFQLGDENYGLPIASVDEVILVPLEITRIPGAPSFVMGVTNLRGTVVPLIDQRARFDVSVAGQTAKARAIIVSLGNLKAGFVVDGVSEVRAISSEALSAAPEFVCERTEIFDRIAQIDLDGKMILLIDPQQLLSRAERDVVAELTEKSVAEREL